jgi:NADH-quinone oxidoreductase subunit M
MMGAPLMGAFLILLIPAHQRRLIQAVALLHGAIALVLSWSLLGRFDRHTPALQFIERPNWPLQLGVSFTLGLDGLSFPLVLLTTLIAVVALVASLGIRERIKAYFGWFLTLEFAILGVFLSQDWSIFYMCWEITLIPLFFLIAVWGGKQRSTASLSFFLYTMGGSVFMLLVLILAYIYTPTHSFAMDEMAKAGARLPRSLQLVVFAGFYIGFAVKIPAFPLHGWLPLAHVEAPTPVSIMLSAVMLKMGGYGLMRITSMVPLGVQQFAPILTGIALINILYGALLAFRQTDLKAMIAYSSISHMGFVLLGIAGLNTPGFIGAALQMVTHGVISAAMFLLVGLLYERTHSRNISDYGGLASVVPVYTVLLSLAMLASMGLPGLAGFVSELHVLVGVFERWRFFVVLATAGVLITAAYSLSTIGRLFMGPVHPKCTHLRDLKPLEIVLAAPLCALMIGIGLVPNTALGLVTATLARMAAVF